MSNNDSLSLDQFTRRLLAAAAALLVLLSGLTSLFSYQQLEQNRALEEDIEILIDELRAPE